MSDETISLFLSRLCLFLLMSTANLWMQDDLWNNYDMFRDRVWLNVHMIRTAKWVRAVGVDVLTEALAGIAQDIVVF